MVEFMYPLIQGHDSIVLESDVELGGSDQLFNMLVGRSFAKEKGATRKKVITMPLLVGLDGSKTSKSDNYIAFNDSSKEDIFGKTMFISDDVMWDYYRLLLLKETAMGCPKKSHPMDAKANGFLNLPHCFGHDVSGSKPMPFFQSFFQRGKPR